MGPDRHSLHPGSLTCPSEGWGQRGGCVRDCVRGRCVWGRCVCGEGVLTLYVSQFRKKLTEPSRRLWMTVQPPGSCLWSHHTCMRRLVFSGFTR